MTATAPASVRPRAAGFLLFAAVAAVHVAAIALGADAIAYPTKLLLMPALAVAVVIAAPGQLRAVALLLTAIGLSWLGDGASFFFPFLADELPAMLLCFGLAHLAYIAIFWRQVRVRRMPVWTAVYIVWWVAMLAVLWPHLGALTIAVAVYGLVLGGTAAMATRGGAITEVGGAFFLASDTILALRLFLPGVDGEVTGPWIMLTYAVGQGLLAYGIVRAVRARA